MSTATATRSAPRPTRPAPTRQVPHLKLVRPRRSQAAWAPFLVFLVVVLAAGLLGLLALNTVLAQDAFTLHKLKVQTAELADREQALQREVNALEAPAVLAARAAAMGMVVNHFPLFLNPRTGRVLGNVSGEQAAIPLAPTGLPSAAGAR